MKKNISLSTLILISLFFLSACSAAVANSAIEADAQLLAPTHTSTPASTDTITPLEAFAEALTPTPTIDPLALPVLNAEQSYKMIATVHANILSVAAWVNQGLNQYEKQAVVGSVAELSMAPLAELFGQYIPDPAFDALWQTAKEIHTAFYPQLQTWVSSEMEDENFAGALNALMARSTEMIDEADNIARQQFNLNVNQYTPTYSLAMEIVFELQASQPGVAARMQESPLLPTEEALLENTDLVVKDLTPYLYDFAGSEFFLVVGMLENTGEIPLTHVRVEVRYYDAKRDYIGTSQGELANQAALPGGLYAFTASTIIDGDAAIIRQSWDTYQVTVYAQPLAAEATQHYQDFSLTLSDAKQNVLGDYLIEGTLTNLGTKTVNGSEILVSVMAFDANEKLVGVGEGLALLEGPLAPGMAVPFTAALQSVSGNPVRYLFVAEIAIEN